MTTSKINSVLISRDIANATEKSANEIFRRADMATGVSIASSKKRYLVTVVETFRAENRSNSQI